MPLVPGTVHAEWTSFGPSDGFTPDLVGPILEDRDGDLWFLSVDDPPDGVARYDGATVQRLRAADGLAHDTVHDVIEDRAGDLWFCTEAGISRLHGGTWTTFTTLDGLPSNEVLGVLQDSRGILWFATATGPARFNNGTFETFASNPVVGSLRLDILFEDKQGRIWFLSRSYFESPSLLAFDGVSWLSIPAPPSGVFPLAIGSFAAADSVGGIWIRSGSGVSRFDGSSWQEFPIIDAADMLVDRMGDIWFASSQGIDRFDGVTWYRYPGFNLNPGLNMGDGQVLALDRYGYVWAGFDVSVARWDGVSWRAYTPEDGTPSMGPTLIFEERNGNLWFGGTGLHRYDRSNWRTFTSADGLPSDDIELGIVEDTEGGIWVASREDGIASYNRQTWARYPAGVGPPGDVVRTMIADRRGGVWVATSAGGVSWFDPVSRAWTHHLRDPGQYLVLKSSLQDRSGMLWFGSDAGLYRYDGTSWRGFGAADGLHGDHILGQFEDRSGALWVESAPPPGIPGAAGVSRWNGATWSKIVDVAMTPRLQTRDGRIWFRTSTGIAAFDGATWDSLSWGTDSLQVSVWGMAEDPQGNLWVGLDFDSVYVYDEVAQAEVRRYDGSTWTSYPLPPDAFGRTLLVDRTGALWVFGRGGARFDGEAWWTLRLPSGQRLRSIYSVLESRGGEIWMGGDNFGVIECEPDRVAPRPVITPSPPKISANPNPSLTFRAAYRETKGVEFSYQLDGGLPSPWSPGDFFLASGLPDGVHRFEVRARDGFGNLSTGPDVAIFEIDAAPPVPLVSSPRFGEAVRGEVQVSGRASDSRFRVYRVEVQPAGRLWLPSETTLLAQSGTPVEDGPIARWDTSSFADGPYDLRLSVLDSLGLTGRAQITLVVDNQFPFADATAPARVVAVAGGDIYTTSQELHLYFPPRAFEQDVLVSIVPATALPDTLATGAIRVLPGYDISWGSTSLRKPATLEFSTAGATTPGALAIYTTADGSSWQRLGGTTVLKKVSLTIRTAGTYALFAETTAPSGDATLSTLSFTPRVFSVAGRFANDHVAIGFVLGRAAPVTVRVYNRAGRLIREVMSGQGMNAGANLVQWNGRDRDGGFVKDGLYLVTVEALGHTERRTLAVVR